MSTTATKTITIAECLNLIHATEGRIFSVVFVKRTTGELREMTCRTGVHSYRKGGELAYDPQAKGLITIFDMAPNKGYRSIPVEGIQRIKVKGEWLEVR
jgi:hypothetical protein